MTISLNRTRSPVAMKNPSPFTNLEERLHMGCILVNQKTKIRQEDIMPMTMWYTAMNRKLAS